MPKKKALTRASKAPAKKAATKAATKAAKKTGPRAAKNPAISPLRFAHPFFTPGGGKGHTAADRMLGHIATKLTAIPPVRGKSTMDLADVIGAAGAKQIADARSITLHAMGDSGNGPNSAQGAVATAMAKDYDPAKPATSPALLYHLGDVVYHPNKDQHYKEEFYEPYVHYPGKIVAIPGNHDGEVFPTTDPVTLRAFLANFCAASQKVPAIAGTIFRETMNQPGVYWLLRAPFVDVIGLYSNSAENPGFIESPSIGTAQSTWLQSTLAMIAAERKQQQRKALVIATHHPPYTSGGHSPSPDMLADIDKACAAADVGPDLFLSGHAHSYQRYTRFVQQGGKEAQIPYIVAGTGGVGEQAVDKPTKKRVGDVRFDNALKGYGYLSVTVSASTIVTTFTEVDVGSGKTSVFETATLDLGTMTVST